MDKEFYELENGKVTSNIEMYAIQNKLKLILIVDKDGTVTRFK